MFTLSENLHPEIITLLGHFVRTTYRASSSNEFNKTVLANAVSLLNRDCAYVNIDNSNGHLCDSYPEVIPFLISETIEVDSTKLSDLLSKCKRARCRNRFVVPVIKFGDRLMCRSATLSAAVEMLYRNGWDYLFGSKSPIDVPGNSQVLTNKESFDNIRGADIQLLKFLGVSHIVDFMLENRKYKYGLKVTSSEKIDKENRYSPFSIVSLPFPGVEHFSDWVDNGYSASGLRFDWSQDFITAEMKIPDDIAARINFNSPNKPVSDLESSLSNWASVYQHWDTVKLTQAYLKLLLKVFLQESNGVLVHCISGWDRTPLFISLARLSLWADGAIHKSLNAAEMLYFTIAYDWFLFSHDLVDRGKNRQEIFRFCFSMLQHLEDDEFSINALLSSETPIVATYSTENALRRSRLELVRMIFENAYAMSCTSYPESASSVIDGYQSTSSPQSLLTQTLPNSFSSLSRWFGNLSNGPSTTG